MISRLEIRIEPYTWAEPGQTDLQFRVQILLDGESWTYQRSWPRAVSSDSRLMFEAMLSWAQQALAQSLEQRCLRRAEEELVKESDHGL